MGRIALQNECHLHEVQNPLIREAWLSSAMFDAHPQHGTYLHALCHEKSANWDTALNVLFSICGSGQGDPPALDPRREIPWLAPLLESPPYPPGVKTLYRMVKNSDDPMAFEADCQMIQTYFPEWYEKAQQTILVCQSLVSHDDFESDYVRCMEIATLAQTMHTATSQPQAQEHRLPSEMLAFENQG